MLSITKLFIYTNRDVHPRTEVHFERRAERRHTTKQGREGMKKRDIFLKYPDKSKATDLINRLYKGGLYYFDPDFPRDEEDWFSSNKYPSTIYGFVSNNMEINFQIR